MLGDARVKPKQKLNWILWWRIDPDELQDQVAKYESLGWFDSQAVVLMRDLEIVGVGPPLPVLNWFAQRWSESQELLRHLEVGGIWPGLADDPPMPFLRFPKYALIEHHPRRFGR